MASVDFNDIYDSLTKLLPSQFNAVIRGARAPSIHFAADSEPLARRAGDLCTWAEQNEANGEALRAALLKVMQPQRTREARAAPPPREPGSTAASRAPIVIAVQDAQTPLEERQLLRAERHMTVTLSPQQLAALDAAGAAIDAAVSLGELYGAGRRAWQVLLAAQPGLSDLALAVRDAQAPGEPPQPVAWAGTAALLLRLCKPVALACIDHADAVASLVTVCCGAHYFHPLADAGAPRSMPKRQQRAGAITPAVRTLLVADDAAAEAALQREFATAPPGEVVLLSAVQVDAALRGVAEYVRRNTHAPTRLCIALGASQPTAEGLQHLMAALPAVSTGGPALRDDALLRDIEQRLPALLAQQAVPVALAPLRTAVLERAHSRGDVALFRDACAWLTWSWVGRPLFASRFGEVVGAAYPHLMDLRSVSTPDWYFDRGKDIADPYQAENLLQRDADPARRFHLYLSGAGGTGKSCFLRYVHDQLERNQPQVLPVWYKVDAPSSEWDNVERRIKQEVRHALQRRLGHEATQALLDDRRDLGYFLQDLVRRLVAQESEIDEVVVFIDQLERTFESGDNPELSRLEKISSKFIKLLATVGSGKGVRFFIASRKQYLPDFLTSFQKASDYNLHFNVLQKIGDDGEQVGFVQRVLDWCQRNKLVDGSVRIDESAAKTLAGGVDGHPLNMMLALIQVFSQNPKGEIGRADIERRAPWQQLFYVDEQLAGQDEIDWYFFLAMAHARTEIVRFEEVWWRLRLVSPALTQRVDNLGRQGVLERLWMLGHLGRTVHPRPLGDDPAAFVEFFHANLRDHLIGTVMNHGADEFGGSGRRGGTPAAWRALDRLVGAARDWRQSQQLMLREDVDALMRHKEVFVSKIRKEGGDTEIEAAWLLFLRDTAEQREALFQAAKECFVYSALVHDQLGRWAFRQLFPNVAEQVACCQRWLQRCDRDSRIRLLQYLIELRDAGADRLLSRLVLEAPALRPEDDAAQQLASVLAEPLVASRYRGAFVLALLRHAVEADPSFPSDDLPTQRFGSCCAAACNGHRDQLVALLDGLAEGVAALQHPPLINAVNTLLQARHFVDRWLSEAAGRGIDPTLASREIHDIAPPRVELRFGAALWAAGVAELAPGWFSHLQDRLGLPLPVPAVSERERVACDASDAARGFEMELLIDGRMVALGQFRMGCVRLPRRDWGEASRALPADTAETFDEALDDCVVWLAPDQLQLAERPAAGREWRAAIVEWLDTLLRRHLDLAFTVYDVIPFLNAVVASGDPRLSQLELQRTVADNLEPLWEVLVNLARERVPLGERRVETMVRLQELVRQNRNVDSAFLTQKLREHASAELCRAFADGTNQLPLMLLDPELENGLIRKLRIAENRAALELDTLHTLGLAAAIRGQFEMVLRTQHVAPVLVCDDRLRLPLFSLIRHFHAQIQVLSISELSSEVRPTMTGFVSGVALGLDT